MKYRLYKDDVIYSVTTSIKGLRAQCGFITGFPSNSNSTINLCSELLNNGSHWVYYKGDKVLITLKEAES